MQTLTAVVDGLVTVISHPTVTHLGSAIGGVIAAETTKKLLTRRKAGEVALKDPILFANRRDDRQDDVRRIHFTLYGWFFSSFDGPRTLEKLRLQLAEGENDSIWLYFCDEVSEKPIPHLEIEAGRPKPFKVVANTRFGLFNVPEYLTRREASGVVAQATHAYLLATDSASQKVHRFLLSDDVAHLPEPEQK